MTIEAPFSAQTMRDAGTPRGPSARTRFAEGVRQARDWLDIAGRDGVRTVRERSAIAASTGRAQIERAQSMVEHHARRRPLLVTGLAMTAGLALGLSLRAGARRRRR